MNNASNITFYDLLFLVLLVLKLTGVISWSWLLVTAPMWGPVLVIVIIPIIKGIIK